MNGQSRFFGICPYLYDTGTFCLSAIAMVFTDFCFFYIL
ncbi:hypothetical protein AR1Y2_0262 [Anaerostipes rhamnosivorans]|uniref:Uncharacterized protein n=1 Tax=Anaerostipes rhamnosivorans TaxID=1229621 RepID=A0A4P8I8K7_9FIRM|nr:hypothetical protein AR1Y2_0262 [Anaerostipes rhamnosivorans]